ncbi:MAG: hypothetical protein ACI4V7_09180 [Succinivibrionaceae bacterium]
MSTNTEFILPSVKNLLGIDNDCKSFDDQLVMHINSVFTILKRMGVGPSEGFSIKGETERWEDFIQDDIDLESVKSYMHLKVRLIFDPPNGSAMMEAIKENIKELEWSLNFEADAMADSEEA